MGAIPHGALTAALGPRSRSGVAVGAVLFLVILGGCAGTLTVRADTAPCVPPGMPPVATWSVLQGRVVALRDVNRQTVYAALMEYTIGATRALGLWLGWGLVFVDPDADDPGRQFWRNRGALDAQWAVVGAPTCDWVEDSGRRA